MSATEYRWGTVEMLPDGHRQFYTDDPKRVAVADDSGREPQDCDDGILWYDFSRPLTITRSEVEVFSIPLVSERNDEQSRTISNAATLLILSVEFKWPIQYKHTTYQVTEI